MFLLKLKYSNFTIIRRIVKEIICIVSWCVYISDTVYMGIYISLKFHFFQWNYLYQIHWWKKKLKAGRICPLEKYMKVIPNSVDLNQNFLCCQQTYFQSFHILIKKKKNRATVNLNYSFLLCIIIYIFIHQEFSDKGQYPMRDEKAWFLNHIFAFLNSKSSFPAAQS